MIGEYVLILPSRDKDFKLNTYLGKLEKGGILSETRKMRSAPMPIKYYGNSGKHPEVLLYFSDIRLNYPYELPEIFRILRLSKEENEFLAGRPHGLEYVLPYPLYGSFPSVSFIEEKHDEPFSECEAIYDYLKLGSNCFERTDANLHVKENAEVL